MKKLLIALLCCGSVSCAYSISIAQSSVQGNNSKTPNFYAKEIKNPELDKKIKKIKGELAEINNDLVKEFQIYYKNQNWDGVRSLNSSLSYYTTISRYIDSVSLSLDFMSLIDMKNIDAGQAILDREMLNLNLNIQALLGNAQGIDPDMTGSLVNAISSNNDPLAKKMLMQLLDIAKETSKVYDEYNS
jgi:hypothetical protein